MTKFSVSLEDELYRRVRAAAGAGGVSGWLAEAAAFRLRSEVLGLVADDIEAATGGPYTERELTEARQWLHSSSTPAA